MKEAPFSDWPCRIAPDRANCRALGVVPFEALDQPPGFGGWEGFVESVSYPALRVPEPSRFLKRNAFTLARLGHTAKTRHQKRPAETGGRNGASIAKFRTRRPAHICETSRYGAVFERPSYLTRLRRTGWLGRQDSNHCISELGFATTLSSGRGSNLRISN